MAFVTTQHVLNTAALRSMVPISSGAERQFYISFKKKRSSCFCVA